MLHYVVRYTDNAVGSPIDLELGRLGVSHVIFARFIDLKYRHPFELVSRVYPRLFRFAAATAVRSLGLARPPPDVVIIGTDVEAVVFGLCRLVLRRRSLLVFETVILKERAGLPGLLFRLYYNAVLSLVGLGICHSELETRRYAARFRGARGKLVTVPYGTGLQDGAWFERATQAAARGHQAYIVAAGRSGRDYATLARAVEHLPCRLKIICDVEAALQGVTPSGQIIIERACSGADYLAALADSLCVVVPLSVDDISAGQMVLLQAASMGKAVILTRTSTTEHYATHGEDALLVRSGDVADLRAAIMRLLEDPAERHRLGRNARDRCLREHSTESYVRRLIAQIQQRLAAGDDAG